MSELAVDPTNWRAALSQVAELSAPVVYGDVGIENQLRDIGASAVLNDIGILAQIDASELGVRGTTRRERLSVALSDLLPTLARIDRSLFVKADECARYTLALTDRRAAPQASAAGVLSVRRVRGEMRSQDRIVETTGVEAQLVQVTLDPADATRNVLRYVTARLVAANDDERVQKLSIAADPGKFARGQFADIEAGDAYYALVAQLYEWLVGPPSRLIDRDDIVGARAGVDVQTADRLATERRRGQLIADLVRNSVSSDQRVLNAYVALLENWLFESRAVLRDVDPRNAPDANADVLRADPRDLLADYRARMITDATRDYTLPQFGWPEQPANLRRAARAWSARFFDAFYAPCALDYLARGAREWQESERAQEELDADTWALYGGEWSPDDDAIGLDADEDGFDEDTDELDENTGANRAFRTVLGLASGAAPDDPITVRIVVRQKTARHPLYGRGGPLAYAALVPGTGFGEPLVLRASRTYRLTIDGRPNHPLVIGTDPTGGPAALATALLPRPAARGVVSGELVFSARQLERAARGRPLYVTCANHPHMGFRLAIDTAA